MRRTFRPGRALRGEERGDHGGRALTSKQFQAYLFTVARRSNVEVEHVARWDKARLRELDTLGAALVGALAEPVPGSDTEPTEFVLVAYLYRPPDRFVFTGRGFGHGVGMSQWGAQGMALAGATYEQILTHYYKGIALTQVGGG